MVDEAPPIPEGEPSSSTATIHQSWYPGARCTSSVTAATEDYCGSQTQDSSIGMSILAIQYY